MNDQATDFHRTLLEQEGLLLVSDTTPRASVERQASRRAAGAFLANIEGLGFGLTRPAFAHLETLSVQDQAELHAWAWPVLMKMVGAHRNYRPMYPNFPRQVMEARQSELLFNALMHYAGDIIGYRYLPDYPVEDRPRLREAGQKARPLSVVGPREAAQRMGRWLESGQSWSPSQKDAALAGLAWLAAQDLSACLRLVGEATLPNRENRAHVAAFLVRHYEACRKEGAAASVAAIERAWPLANTSVVDVLRTAVALAGGDVSLAENTRFVSPSRAVRRLLMRALDVAVPQTPTAEEDVFNRRETWLRLGEKLHPGEFKQFENASLIFDVLRNQDAPVSLMGKLDAALSKKSSTAVAASVAALFEQRPGLMARQLHRILRWANPRASVIILDAFEQVADKCATGLLLSVGHVFRTQGDRTQRAVMPKGSVAKIRMTEKVPDPVDDGIAARVAEIAEQALVARFARLPSLGACYIDPALADVPTPFALRSTSKALRTVPRGSRLPLDDAKVTRLFLWWSQSDPAGNLPSVERIDIDLSCVVLDEGFNKVSECTYYDLRGRGLTHSGDITSAPRGACEFVDIEHAKLPPGSRYVVMSINSYTNQPYANVPECFAGWMSRKDGRRGELHEPRTVANRFDLTSDSQAVVPMVMDLVDKKVIWMDMAYSTRASYSNNVSTHGERLRQAVEGVLALSRPSLAYLFGLHVRARGQAVDTPSQAQVLFTLAPQGDKPGVNATAMEVITSDWMADQASVPAAVPARSGKLAKAR